MTRARRLLIVDDDADLRQALVEQLALHPEFQVEAVETAKAALKAVAAATPDLIIMDVGLPDLDGREAVKRMRREGYRRPIIVLTAHDSDADAVLGLDSGANDYIGKPFRFVVLLARIRSQLRQYEASEDAEFQVGPYTFRPTSKNLVDAQGVKLRLTEKEAAILRYLHRAEQQPVARETLLKHVWGYNANVTTHTLETHIYRLRQKIEHNPAEAQLLVTEGGGYKLVAPAAAGGDRSDARRRCCAARAHSPVQPHAARGRAAHSLFVREAAPGRRRHAVLRRRDRRRWLLRPLGRDQALEDEAEPNGARRVGAGALIGESALYAPIARRVEARAAEDAVVMRVPRETFRRVLAEFPAAADRIRAALAARTRQLVDGLEAARVKSFDGAAAPGPRAAP